MKHKVLHMHRPSRVAYPVPKGKKFSGKLGRAGKWLFDKLAVDDWTSKESVKFDTVTISPVTLIEEISKQKHAIDRLYRSEIEFIVVGREFFFEAITAHPFAFNLPFHLDGPHGYRIFDIPVRFVPWFEGLLLIPKQN